MSLSETRFKPGPKHPNWQGGRHLDGYGYVKVLVDTGYYVSEHILILEWYLERKLEPDECSHHCNEIRCDNRLENIELMLKSEHTKYHQTGRKASKETKKKLRLIRKGTNQKEKHPQWKNEITRSVILENLKKHQKQKTVAKIFKISPDTLRSRMRYYKIRREEW